MVLVVGAAVAVALVEGVVVEDTQYGGAHPVAFAVCACV